VLRLTLFLLALLPGLALADGALLQSEGRDAVNPPRTVDLQHLALDLKIDVIGGTVAGTATWTADPLRDGVTQVVFDQIALDIIGVHVDGASAAYRQTDLKLFVDLPSDTRRGTPLTVEVLYEAEPTNGLHFRGPGKDSPDRYPEVWSQGEDVDHRHWFPLWNDPSDRFTYEGRFTVESRFSVVSNGVLRSTAKAEGDPRWSTWHYALEQDLTGYLVALAVGPYTKLEHHSEGGVPLETWVGPNVDEAVALATTRHTEAMLALFAVETGVPYPYPVYRQVFVQRFMYGGMENTTTTIQTDAALHPLRLFEEADSSDSLVSHELAHQWYGDQLTCANWREMWLNEGFATYFAAVWGAHKLGPEHDAIRAWRTYKGVRGSDDGTARPLVRSFYNQTDGERSANPYGKGSSVLRMLQVMLGDDVFDRSIALYTSRRQHSVVQTEHLRAAFEEVSGQNLDWFFDQWVYLVGHPKLSVKHSIDVDQGRLRVSIEQTQTVEGAWPLFVVPVDLEIATSTGTRIERVWLDGAKSVAASWPIDGDLLYVGVDPHGGLLAEITHKRSSEELLATLGSEHPYSVILALDELHTREGRPSDEERAAVAALLGDADGALAWRKKAARILGAWRDNASTAVLLETLSAEQRRLQQGGSSSARVRATLTDALGDGAGRDDVVAALKGVVAKDPNERVRADAIRALGKLREGGARSVALTALQTDSHSQAVERAGADLLGRHGVATDLKALAAHRSADTPRGLLHAALWASARIANRQPVGKERDEARRPVARDAERLLVSDDLRTRQTARQILAQVGDDRSIAALEAAKRFETDPQLLEPLATAIDTIRKRKDTDPDPTEGELDARLKQIEERLDTAEEELKELEERR